MKVLILNSGMGSRMGVLASEQPKCMTEISGTETILSRQLRAFVDVGVNDFVITTGKFDAVLMRYVDSLDLPINVTFLKNEKYAETNYIYSIYCAKKYLDDDIILLHGDLVFENEVIDMVMEHDGSCMTVSTSLPLPEKDFKAVIENGMIKKVGIDLFNFSVAAQPFYKLLKKDWLCWLNEIVSFCERGDTNCYAENALNDVAFFCDEDKDGQYDESGICRINALDVRDLLCAEIDTPEDLAVVSGKLDDVNRRTVYMCFSTDILHSAHIAMIRKAARLGKVIIGVMTDEAVMSYKRFPLLPFDERKAMFENIKGVYRVVSQDSLDYTDNIRKYHPDFVVHGDDWFSGFQRPIRDGVVSALAGYGGRLVEYPYANDEKYRILDKRAMEELSLPDVRRSRLKRILDVKGFATAIEAHNGLTGLIAEKTAVYKNGEAHQFDAMWISSLCDSTAKGKPDIELVDMTSRFRTIDDITEVTTKPIIFDGDTGGLAEHFAYTVRTLERMGVSMVIIEDKTGLKKNSLFGTEVEQMQEDIDVFSEKIRVGKKSKKTSDFLICARIESLILEKGVDDALNRAFAYVSAGADAIMIHSRKKEPDEIFGFVREFRNKDNYTPIVVVPTSFNGVTEEELKEAGINIVVYANQLTRSAFPAMKRVAESILENHRARECDEYCMPFKEIISLIPEDV